MCGAVRASETIFLKYKRQGRLSVISLSNILAPWIPAFYLLTWTAPGWRSHLWLSTPVQLKDRMWLGALAPSFLEVADLPLNS